MQNIIQPADLTVDLDVSNLCWSDLFLLINPFETITPSTIKKILYRYQVNLPCSFEYLHHHLNISVRTSYAYLAVLELLKRKTQDQLLSPRIQAPKDFAIFLRKETVKQPFEGFYVGFLNHKNTLLEVKKLFTGKSDHLNFDMTVFFKHILCSQVSNILIAHNHPSGDPQPSQQDIELTLKIKHLFSVFDLNLVDHIIISEQSYYSFINQKVIYFDASVDS